MQWQGIIYSDLNIHVSFPLGLPMVPFQSDKFILKQKSSRKILDNMNLQNHLLMSFFGETSTNSGLWDSKTKVSVNMEFTIGLTMTGKLTKALLKDGN